MSPKPGKSVYLRGGYLAPTERVLFETHPSKWFYFPLPVLCLGAFGIADYLVGTTVYPRLPALGWLSRALENLLPSSYSGLPDPRVLLLIACLVGTLAVVGWLFWRMYLWIRDTYVLTDDRIIEQKGIIRTSQEDIPLNQIRDVDVLQLTYRSRLFRFGTVEFKSLSQLEVWEDVPEPAYSISGGLMSPIPKVLNTRPRYLWNPLDPEAVRSGVEKWVGVPTPVRIERMVEQALRDRSTGPPKPPSGP